ncbi:MAG TPA: sigma-54 dependent transcriptional regulator [Candidatus Polarisedimenticolia bacterium]
MMKKPGGTAPRGRLLIVEDEAYVRESLSDMLGARGYEVSSTASPELALDALSRTPVDVVLTDLNMPGSGGLGLIRSMEELYPGVPVVVLTGFGTIASAVECIRAGASDYILKPADPDALEVALARAMTARALRREVAYLRGSVPGAPAAGDDLPVGVSPAWMQVIGMVRAAAPSDATVLLTGESGTGKEVLARLLHRISPRARGPYVRVNCAAVPIEMWESEFFGHRRGSYTGATADREGRFLLADRGTLFMDEVGAMPLPAQAKILRVLQDGEFDRLGDEKPTRVDVRIIAATNSDLEADVASGRFRQDLFYRINVLRIDVPPLRARPEDISPLTDRFVREISARLGRPAPAVTGPALDALMSYSWPGNVRELRNVIERALILNPGPVLHLPDLPAAQETSAPCAPAGEPELNLRLALGKREKDVVLEALRLSDGVRKEAARLLGIDQRNLGYYLRKHGIDPDKIL